MNQGKHLSIDETNMNDKQRRRWRVATSQLGLDDPTDPAFAQGGLARLMDTVGLRILVLPGDPLDGSVRLDDATKTRFDERVRQLAHIGGGWTRVTSNALVSYSRRRDDAGWSSYVSQLRNGGVDVTIDHVSSEKDEVKWFFLATVVDIARSTLALAKDAIQERDVPGPFELTVALADTENGHLGGFAQGWTQNPWHDEEISCIEPNLLLRWESESPFDPDEDAARVGERIENAFGTTMRRFDPPQQD